MLLTLNKFFSIYFSKLFSAYFHELSVMTYENSLNFGFLWSLTEWKSKSRGLDLPEYYRRIFRSGSVPRDNRHVVGTQNP